MWQAGELRGGTSVLHLPLCMAEVAWLWSVDRVRLGVAEPDTALGWLQPSGLTASLCSASHDAWQEFLFTNKRWGTGRSVLTKAQLAPIRACWPTDAAVFDQLRAEWPRDVLRGCLWTIAQRYAQEFPYVAGWTPLDR